MTYDASEAVGHRFGGEVSLDVLRGYRRSNFVFLLFSKGFNEGGSRPHCGQLLVNSVCSPHCGYRETSNSMALRWAFGRA